MPSSTPCIRRINLRISVSPYTDILIRRIAARYGIKFNHGGALLDTMIDLMDDAKGVRVENQRQGVGKPAGLTHEQVRSIRSSTDKLAVIASENGISEKMARLIRRREFYRWVK